MFIQIVEVARRLGRAFDFLESLNFSGQLIGRGREVGLFDFPHWTHIQAGWIQKRYHRQLCTKRIQGPGGRVAGEDHIGFLK